MKFGIREIRREAIHRINDIGSVSDSMYVPLRIGTESWGSTSRITWHYSNGLISTVQDNVSRLSCSTFVHMTRDSRSLFLHCVDCPKQSLNLVYCL
jgi:hypothetical protein